MKKMKKRHIIAIAWIIIGIPLGLYVQYNGKQIVTFIQAKWVESDIKNDKYIKPNKEQISSISYYLKDIDSALLYKAILDVEDISLKCSLINKTASSYRKDMIPFIDEILKRGYKNNLDLLSNRRILFYAMLAKESLNNDYQPIDNYNYERDYIKPVIVKGKIITSKPGKLDLVSLRKIAQEVLLELKTKDKSKFAATNQPKISSNNNHTGKKGL